MTEAIKQMWQCPMPDPSKEATGFPILNNVVRTPLYQPEREDGAYNHHPKITHHEGMFYAMWSNHLYGEDGPGQRIMYSVSRDGRRWQKAEALFEPIGETKPSEEKGLVLTPFCWIALSNKFYALVGANANIGFTDPNNQGLGDVRNAQFPRRARKGYAVLAREIMDEGSRHGDVFALWDNIPPDTLYPILGPGQVPDAEALNQYIRRPQHQPSWDFSGDFHFPRKANGGRLCEPTIYTANDGTVMMLLRDSEHSHRMFASQWDKRANRWITATSTNIPDSPSLTCNVRLDDGTILLIGNQTAPAFESERGHYARNPLTVAVSRDGYAFTKVFALRTDAHHHRVEGIKGRGTGGAQYPNALVHDGMLYVIHSMAKEDIEVSEVPLEEILGKEGVRS